MIDKRWSQVKRVLAIRLDNLGDVLVTTPALHAIKTSLPAATLTLLASPVGAQVARLNPDLDDVIIYQAPWMDPWHKLPQDSQREQQVIATIRERRFDGAIIFTSFRQSPLPAAYLCYLADIPLRVAASIDGPGSLLTTRHKNPPITSDKGGIASQLPQGGIAEREQLHKNDKTSRSGFQGSGTIINIASAAGFVPFPARAAYNASKGAVISFTRALALDYASNHIRVNAICPGMVETSMTRWRLDIPELRQQVIDMTPWGRIGRAEDIAAAAVYLASDEADFVTGHMLVIDGGWTIS